MSEMIERVAAAMREKIYVNSDGSLEYVEEAARAAIEAMREPTEAMRNGAEEAHGRDDHYTPGSVWPAMINAALAEP